MLLQTLYRLKECLGFLLLAALVLYLWFTPSPDQPTLPDASQRQGPTSGSTVTRSVGNPTGVAPVTSDGTLSNRWPQASSNAANGLTGQTPAASGRWSTPSFQTSSFQITAPGPSGRWSTPSFQTNPFQTPASGSSSGSPTPRFSTPSFQSNPFQPAKSGSPGGSPTPRFSTPSFQGNPFQAARNSPSPSPAGQSPTTEDPSLANRRTNGPK